MARLCTVCSHPARAAIDRAIIAGDTPYRRIAGQFGLAETSLRRHVSDHLLREVVQAWQEERAQNGQDLLSDLREWMDRLKLQHDACDAFLRDPDDPTRYTLAPRAHEVVVYTTVERGPNRQPERRKATLQELLDRVDGAEGVSDVALVEHKAADPRELLLKTSARLETHLRLVGEFLGKLQSGTTVNFLVSPEWLALRGRMLAALAHYPEARLALAATLDGEAREETED